MQSCFDGGAGVVGVHMHRISGPWGAAAMATDSPSSSSRARSSAAPTAEQSTNSYITSNCGGATMGTLGSVGEAG